MSSTSLSQAVTIKRADETDASGIDSLLDECLGSADTIHLGDTHPIELTKSTHSPCNIFVATASNNIIGVVVIYTLSSTALQQWVGSDIISPPKNSLNGIIQAIAVSPTQQHNGVASALLDRALIEFETRNASCVYAVSWCRTDDIDSSDLFEKFNFTDLHHISNYFTDCLPRYHCPDCNTELCTCDATIYKKDLTND